MTRAASRLRSTVIVSGTAAALAVSLTVAATTAAHGDAASGSFRQAGHAGRAGQAGHAGHADKRSLVIVGHGFGHGHGMSQYGAQGAALQGVKYRHIVDFYYPHTAWAQAHGRIRVLISADTTSDLEVRPAPGLVVRDSRRQHSWTLPTGGRYYRWRLHPLPNGFTAVEYLSKSGWHRWHIPDGRKTFKTDAEFHARGPLRLLVPGGGDVVGVPYRGTLRLASPSSGSRARDTVNVLSLDAYVKGVVPYEMPASWRQSALRAQAVAARTFAAWERSQNRDSDYQICDTTSCQVYGGLPAEQDSSNRAVDATAGKIVTYHGRPAMAQFASSSGGWTSYGGEPYLPAKRDPWDRFSGNPMHTWSDRVSASVLERDHPGIGRLLAIHVLTRDGHGAWGGRVESVVLRGSKGKAHVTGDDIRWAYGLPSDWFSVE
jgi:stage II sporulation protein D